MQHVLDERRLAGTGNPCHAHQTLQWDAYVDIAQIVSARHRAAQAICWAAIRRQAPRMRRARFAARRRACGPLKYSPVSDWPLFLMAAGVPKNTISPPRSPAPGAHVENPVSLEHDLRIMLDHQQGIAGIAQGAHHGDHHAACRAGAGQSRAHPARKSVLTSDVPSRR